ncbi:hypothetical protein C1645_815566 [Glomus cerebriforme]|uniref:Uncharacterized protein n=1 Tax=Glomus cerebriforme TaxID=658196 RepID=A0A397TH76_9GLOM|nr:hypothetical protein C1645_815566 [Glomus cerebriforme]
MKKFSKDFRCKSIRSKEVKDIIHTCHYELVAFPTKLTKVKKQIREAEEINNNSRIVSLTDLSYEINSEAFIYTSIT